MAAIFTSPPSSASLGRIKLKTMAGTLVFRYHEGGTATSELETEVMQADSKWLPQEGQDFQQYGGESPNFSMFDDLPEVRDLFSSPRDYKEDLDDCFQELLLAPDYSNYSVWGDDRQIFPSSFEEFAESGYTIELPNGCTLLPEKIDYLVDVNPKTGSPQAFIPVSKSCGVEDSPEIFLSKGQQLLEKANEGKSDTISDKSTVVIIDIISTPKTQKTGSPQLFPAKEQQPLEKATEVKSNMMAEKSSEVKSVFIADSMSTPKTQKRKRSMSKSRHPFTASVHPVLSVSPVPEKESVSFADECNGTQQSVAQPQSMEQLSEKTQNIVVGKKSVVSGQSIAVQAMTSCLSGMASSNSEEEGGEVTSPQLSSKKKFNEAKRSSAEKIKRKFALINSSEHETVDASYNIRTKKKTPLPKEAKRILRAWMERRGIMFPSKKSCMKLAASTGLTISQVKNWFSNTRRQEAARDRDENVAGNDEILNSKFTSMDEEPEHHLGVENRPRTRNATSSRLQLQHNGERESLFASADDVEERALSTISKGKTEASSIASVRRVGQSDMSIGDVTEKIVSEVGDSVQVNTKRQRVSQDDSSKSNRKSFLQNTSVNKKTRYLPKEATEVLQEWFDKNPPVVQPSKSVKMKLAEQSGLSEVQVGNWFHTQHRRLLRASGVASY